MLKVGQQSGVRVRERRAGAHPHRVELRGHVGAADDVQPLLHVCLVYELRRDAGASCLEERVQIELIELALARH